MKIGGKEVQNRLKRLDSAPPQESSLRQGRPIRGSNAQSARFWKARSGRVGQGRATKRHLGKPIRGQRWLKGPTGCGSGETAGERGTELATKEDQW